MATRPKITPPNLSHYRLTYMTDLARGASHIASALSAVSQQAAVEEVVREFQGIHTRGDIVAFLQLLEEDVRKRGANAAAAIIRGMIPPPAVEP